MGRHIYIGVPGDERGIQPHVYDCIVLSFKQFLPADPPERMKHLVQIWTDPGGMRTLSVGSIHYKKEKARDAVGLGPE